MNPSVLALSGGIGGARLALGLYRVLPADSLVVVVNTGDDFEHLGLHVSPDLDTVLYTLADLADPDRGWGRRDETWTFMAALGALGGESWFQLGDGDLAIHVERTRRLRSGETLAKITGDFRHRLGVRAAILPMSNDPVRTTVHVENGVLGFQDYFVREQCRPHVQRLEYAGAERARPLPEFLSVLASEHLDMVMVCPSNPYLSIDPILALPGVVDALAACPATVVAVSPLIAGRAVKGPTAKLMGEFGAAVNNVTIAAHYAPWLDGMVVDVADAVSIDRLPIPAIAVPTLMRTIEDRETLARATIAFGVSLKASLGQRGVTGSVSKGMPG